MDIDRPELASPCALFACWVCRTKTGWPHQRWCELIERTEPRCADCRYWSEKRGECRHPSRNEIQKEAAVR